MPYPQPLTDKLWTALFIAVQVLIGVGCMFLSAAYLTPALVGPPVDGARHGTAKLVEVVLLFGGLFVGLLIAAKVIASLSKRFIDTTTRDRLERQFQESLVGVPAPLRAAMQFINRLGQP